MKYTSFTSISILALAFAASIALTVAPPAQAQQLAEPAPVTRAEVLADLQIWRQSGLARFHDEDSYTSIQGAQYQAALARYKRMRASPEFDALVQAIASRRGERVPQHVAAVDPRR